MTTVYQSVLALMLLFFTIVCRAEPSLISTYDDLLTTLTQGQNVKGILALHECTSQTNVPTPEMYGSLNFNNFNAYEMSEGAQKKKIIATSTTMLIETQQFGPVYNYVRLRIFTDNSAEVTSDFLNPQTFKSEHKSIYACSLSDDKVKGGVTLYRIH